MHDGRKKSRKGHNRIEYCYIGTVERKKFKFSGKGREGLDQKRPIPEGPTTKHISDRRNRLINLLIPNEFFCSVTKGTYSTDLR